MSDGSGGPPGTDARRAFERAVRLHTGGDLAAAVDAYRAILEGYPGAAGCWSNLGWRGLIRDPSDRAASIEPRRTRWRRWTW